MSLIIRLSALITAMKTETKALRTFISGTNNGNVSALTTVATNIVAAINELKAAQGSAGAQIDDVTAAADKVYSSTRTEARIAAEKAAVKADILGTAGPTVDTLKEIADLLSANTDSDAALVAVVANKANSSDVYTQAQIGDPETDLVALWNAA